MRAVAAGAGWRGASAGTIERFEYDPFDRLSQRVIQSALSGVVSHDVSYSYDDIGNLLGRSVQVGTAPSLTLSYGGPGAGPHAVTSSAA